MIDVALHQTPRIVQRQWRSRPDALSFERFVSAPDGGGVRKLGIPSVLDRFIQQAVMQVLQRRWDRTFSDHSYGFRPGRSAYQAVAQAQQFIAEGQGWCVDLDLEKFLDRISYCPLVTERVAVAGHHHYRERRPPPRIPRLPDPVCRPD
jgi:hypothetical protein